MDEEMDVPYLLRDDELASIARNDESFGEMPAAQYLSFAISESGWIRIGHSHEEYEFFRREQLHPTF